MSRPSVLAPWMTAALEAPPFAPFGSVERAGSEVIESRGPALGLGECCRIERADGGALLADVVGFRDGRLVLAPLAPADGLLPGARVVPHAWAGRPRAADALGRVLDGLGRPLDGGEPVPSLLSAPESPSLADRVEVSERFVTGIRVIDSLLACGRGQRLGVFAGAGVGKTTLVSMLLRHAQADAVVLALVGERGREVRRFIDHDLDAATRARSIIIATTGGEQARLRVRAALLAADLADQLRREGRHVLLVTDSLTRLAMAQREVGLAAGEAPTAKGYPPSVFALLPRLVEKAGAYREGSVTAFHAVLVEGDEMTDPVADALRGLLDGHVVLSRELAERGSFPAVDTLSSLSRLMPDLASAEQVRHARRVRRLLAVLRDTRDLVRVGAYRPGTEPEVDAALALEPKYDAFLRQEVLAGMPLEDSLTALARLVTEGAAS